MAWSIPANVVPGTQIASATTNAVLADLAILGGAWTADPRATTAIWTNSGAAVGNGTLVSRYRLTGKTLDWLVSLTFGSSTSGGSGQFTFAYPASFTTLTPGPVATVRLFDNSGPTTYLASGILNTATVNLQSITSAAGVLSAVTATAPMTWGTSDVCAFLVTGLEGS